MRYRKYKAIGLGLPGLCILNVSSKGEKNIKSGDADTVEAALMIFLNVKVREQGNTTGYH